MTDEKSTDTDKPKSNFAKAQQGKDTGTAKAARKRGSGRVWLWLLLLLLLGAAGTWGWLNWPQVQERLAQYLDFLPGRDRQTAGADREKPPAAEPAAPREPQPQDTPPAASTPPQDSAALRNQLRQQGNTIRQLQQQLAELQRSVTAQGNRLGELGNIGRQDWQLAEADYLLRLANQRLLLERDSRAALGLVEEANEILRDVNLPDLYGVRQQLARDLTALKLVENIDREGLYLRLRALEEQLVQVDIRPEFELAKQDAVEEEETPSPAGGEKLPVWERSWQNFTRFMRNSYRVRDVDIDPVLLSPQSEARFRQNLRLNMEQAELALLREDDTVYKDSLERARQLLLEYGTDNHRRQVLARELQELAQQPVIVELPSLSASQSALHNYIERLHKADPQRAPAAPPGGNSEEADSLETDTPNTAGDETQ
ncbi:uroporphyrinogen-III C-methyltransferase [Microbulbifer sp.]|uniref:uroporphyrinogen-III C-methyltransferase n=1 Tax=Microbulbifer sp. TaxID=1908541 RepID=UPI003F2AC8E9